MTTRRTRAARSARAAKLVEDGARATLFQSRQRVHQVTAAIAAEQERSRALLGGDLSPGFRSQLVTTGARHLRSMEAQRDDLARRADGDHQLWQQARLRVRSLDKLVERLGAVEATQQARSENAAWQDLVTGARASNGTTPGPTVPGTKGVRR